MFSSRLVSRIEMKSLPDGNCAFNAFTLGLSDEIYAIENSFSRQGQSPDHVLDHFVKKAAAVFHPPKINWPAIRDNMRQLYISNSEQLQKKVSPVLRHLAIDLAKNDPSQIERTRQPLLSAFYDFLDVEKKLGHVPDDIFCRHGFVMQKFAALKNQPNSEVTLMHWWNRSGYQRFLNEMKKNGVWAGDLELFQLASYFRVNLNVVRGDFTHQIYIHSGTLARHLLSDDQIQQLQVRGVIDGVNNDEVELRLLPLTQQEVTARLDAVPESRQIIAFMQENVPLRGRRVPEGWAEMLSELKLRQVVTRNKGGNEYVFAIDVESAIGRVRAIDGMDDVLRYWRENHLDSPTIYLKNESATHWTSLNETLPMVPALRNPLTATFLPLMNMATGVTAWLWSAYMVMSGQFLQPHSFFNKRSNHIKIAANCHDALFELKLDGLKLKPHLAHNAATVFAKKWAPVKRKEKRMVNNNNLGFCNLL